MNILVTIDSLYIPPLEIMLFSLARQHPNTEITVYLLHENISSKDLTQLDERLRLISITLYPIQVTQDQFKNFPITDRYPFAMYYRLFASHLLPSTLDKILYLDPDMVILNSLEGLYHLELGEYFFAAATHVEKPLEFINQVRLNYSNGIYVNSGVLLMNLSALRQEQDISKIGTYIEQFKNLLILPDQDVLSALYPNKILEINAVQYNMTERMWLKQKLSFSGNELNWISENSHIIHYIGRNKPWLSDYRGDLDIFYHEAVGFRNGFIAAKMASNYLEND